ncbi:MAG: four helix bundle protein [Desulfosarcina sp.]|jgi:four helix bundle protein
MGKGFKNLQVWQRARDLAIDVYRITGEGCFKRDYGMTDQMRRSAVSIPSNIAEGDERDTDKDAIRFLYIAKGSLAELRTQLEIANRVGHVEQAIFQDLDEKAVTIGKMLGSLIKSRSKML